MDKNLFKDLKASLNEAIDHAKGKKELRTTTLPRPPQKMDNAEIAEMRETLKYSQAVFARYLNVSTKTVQAWEQGIGKPSGAALKLLTIAKENPEVVFGK